MQQLNERQQQAFNAVVKARNNTLITGAGGVGKSYLIGAIRQALTSHDIPYAVTASTGAAAILIGGCTIHRWSGCGIFNRSAQQLADGILKNPRRRGVRDAWQGCRVLIIDEISMLDAHVFDTLEHVARIVRKNGKPFGGIQVVACGDFLQLPPVNARGGFCFEAKCWNDVIQSQIELTQVVRQAQGAFQTALCEIRTGRVTADSAALLRSRVGARVGTELIKPTVLYSTRASVSKKNMEELAKIAGPSLLFTATHTFSPYEPSSATARNEIIEKENRNFQARQELQLKVGAQVMLIVNMSNELVNGSRGVVVAFQGGLPIVRFMNGIEMPVQLSKWRSKVGDKLWLERVQIPLILAWALTTHKSQGATLDCVEVDISSCFEYGQAYVALSRVRSLEGLSLKRGDLSHIKADPRVLLFYRTLNGHPIPPPPRLEPPLAPPAASEPSPETKRNSQKRISTFALTSVKKKREKK